MVEPLLVELKYALTECGGQFVMISGMTMVPVLSVDNSDFHRLVCGVQCYDVDGDGIHIMIATIHVELKLMHACRSIC